MSRFRTCGVEDVLGPELYSLVDAAWPHIDCFPAEERDNRRDLVPRLGKVIGTQRHRVPQRLEAVVRPEETLLAGAHAIVIGLDRTTVPTEEPRPGG